MAAVRQRDGTCRQTWWPRGCLRAQSFEPSDPSHRQSSSNGPGRSAPQVREAGPADAKCGFGEPGAGVHLVHAFQEQCVSPVRSPHELAAAWSPVRGFWASTTCHWLKSDKICPYRCHERAFAKTGIAGWVGRQCATLNHLGELAK